MNLFECLFRRPAKIVAVRTWLRLEQLERRDLLNGGPSVMQIADAEYARDGQLTRSDTINLLETVAGTETATISNGNVSFQPVSNPNRNAPLPAQSLSELQTIFANPSQWGMAAATANLSEKVVGYNQANEHYRGKALLKTGELAANDPSYKLSDLVAKWFLGNDLPALNVGGASYKQAAGSLFGPNGPEDSDVAQGCTGDCYFLSNLGEAALQSPQSITSMFVDNHDGTYTVRFYDYDKTTKITSADYVTVNRDLPVDSNGHFVEANRMFGGKQTNVNNTKNILWVALAEKAYAQLAEEGWSRAYMGAKDAANAYASLDIGNNLVAGEQITGNYDGRGVTLRDGTSAQAVATMQALARQFQDGDLLTMCSNMTVTNSHLCSNHVYFVTGIDAANETITLTNPYTTVHARTITISLADAVKNFGGYALVDA
jgi:hypothetical protein